jgi:hypothetical protein
MRFSNILGSSITPTPDFLHLQTAEHAYEDKAGFEIQYSQECVGSNPSAGRS